MSLALMALATGCSSSASTPEPTVSVDAGTDAASSSSSSSTTSLPQLDDGCSAPAPTTLESIGTSHTMVPGELPARFEISTDASTVCPGGEVRLTVTVSNDGRSDVHVDQPIVFGQFNGSFWGLDAHVVADVPADGSTTVIVDARIPAAVPGQYQFGVYGYGPHSAPVEVVLPA